jgi:hypothetical protein
MSALDELFTAVPPVELFQYTSISGLLGIVQSKTLWASNIHYLNDVQEFNRGLNVVREVLDQRCDDPRSSSDEVVFVRRLSAYVAKILKLNVFVASFSEVPDLLSQWRGYTPTGKGVCIGFYSADLAAAGNREGLRLVKVVYEPDAQLRVAIEVVDQAVREFRKNPNTAEEIALQFVTLLALIVPLMKHRAFAEEREWRLVSRVLPARKPHIGVREGKYRLVPYFMLRLTDGQPERLRFSNVWVGPAPDTALALSGVRDGLEINDVEFQNLRSSDTPYREW